MYNLTITESALRQIKLFCSTFPTLEWSGVAFYKITNQTSLEDFDVDLLDIYLMDVGTVTSTEYGFDGDIAVYFLEKYILHGELGVFMGHIHSHNNMTSFFSKTDLHELADNGKQHALYISTIVNNKLQIITKATYAVENLVTVVNNSKLQYKNLDIIKTDETTRQYTETTVYDIEGVVVDDFNAVYSDTHQRLSEIIIKTQVKNRQKLIPQVLPKGPLKNNKTKQKEVIYEQHDEYSFFNSPFLPRH